MRPLNCEGFEGLQPALFSTISLIADLKANKHQTLSNRVQNCEKTELRCLIVTEALIQGCLRHLETERSPKQTTDGR